MKKCDLNKFEKLMQNGFSTLHTYVPSHNNQLTRIWRFGSLRIW